ncbi:MAG: DNA alkylation repair protein [Lachnospiraceae bacterium]|jgi:3-methyladenine DNA glycosylase AlkD|nr:DNA alkylation repair protein [Lachnospiraceae bacterium]
MEYTGERIRELLMEMAEPEYAKFSGALLGREAVMLGVRLPKIRELAKKIAKAEGREYLDNMLPDESPEKQAETKAQDGCKEEQEDFPYMEELMLYGMVIGSMKERLEILFPYIKRYVDRIDNWSLCDSFCAGLKQTKKQPEAMLEFLQPYLNSDREFDLRFGVVMLMDFYVVPDYIDELLRTFDGIHHEGYYVKMAIAWALSVCLVKQWEKSFAYMCSPDNHLDEFTYVKTVQKCRESFRLTKEQKELLTKEKEKRFAKRKVRNVQEK